MRPTTGCGSSSPSTSPATPSFPERPAFEVARELGLPVTTHAGVWGATNDDGIRLMHENGFATPETVYVHAATLNKDSYLRIAASGGSISVSTESEQSAGQGYPPTWQVRRYDIPVSLSMDTSVWWSGDLFSAMRGTLGADRAREHLEAHVAGETVTSAHLRAEHVVDWATRGGAQALGRDDLGSLEAGQKADLVLIKNDDSPVSFPLLNPYGHVAFQAQRADVHTVIIDGRIVKRDHRLVGVDLAKARSAVESTVDYLRSSTWARRSGRPACIRTCLGRQGAGQPVHLHRLPHGGDPGGPGVDLRRSGIELEPEMAGRGTGPDFVEALARGLDVLACFDADRPTMTLSEVAVAAGPGPADRPPAAAHPGRARLRPGQRQHLRADPEGARASGIAYVVLARAVGHRPAAPGGAGRPDRGVLVDGPAGRLRHRLRRPGRRCPRSSRCGSTSAPASRPSGPRRARCCWPRCPRQAARPPSPSRAAPACRRRPSARPPTLQRRADPGPGPGLGAGRRGARPGRTLGRRPGPRRHRHRPRRDERHRARRRDLDRAPAERVPAAAAGDRRPGQRRLGAVAVPPARPAGLTRRRTDFQEEPFMTTLPPTGPVEPVPGPPPGPEPIPTPTPGPPIDPPGDPQPIPDPGPID